MKLAETLPSGLDLTSIVQELSFPAEAAERRRRVDAARGRLRASRSVLFRWCGIVLLVLAGSSMIVAALINGIGGMFAGAALTMLILAVISLWLGDPRAVQRTADTLTGWLAQAQDRLAALIKSREEAIRARAMAALLESQRRLECAQPLQGQGKQLRVWAEALESGVVQFRLHRDTVVKACADASQAEADRLSEMRRACRSFWRFFRPGRVMGRAAAVIDAAEKASIERLGTESLNAALRIFTDLRSTLQRTGDKIGTDLMALSPLANNDRELHTNDEEWPPESMTRNSVVGIFTQQREAILNALACRDAGVPLVDAVRHQAEELVARHPEIVEKDISEHLARLNGRGDMFILEATVLSREWAKIDDSKNPLAPRRRLTTLLAKGGTSSPLYTRFAEAVKGELRSIDVADAGLAGLINETRFSDLAAFPACQDAARVLECTNDDLLGLAVIVEDLDWLKRYTPERDDVDALCERVLVLLVLLRLVMRKGSAIILAPAHRACPVELDGDRLGVGWDDALKRIRSDQMLRDWLVSAVSNHIAQVGDVEFARQIDGALAKPDSIAPAERASQATKILRAVRAEVKPVGR